MFCAYCGAKLVDGARFCERCGRPAGAPAASGPQAGPYEPPRAQAGPAQWQEPAQQPRPAKPSPNVELCPDGKYRWIYEFSMLKNPMILLTLLKVFALVAVLIFAGSFILSLTDGDSVGESLRSAAIPALIAFGIIAVLAIPSYLIVAGRDGWKYIVLFEMDEQGITHQQEPKQFTKAEGMAWLTAMAGALTGNLTAGATGLLAATHDSLRSQFDKVSSIQAVRRWNTIKLNEPLKKNQIYAEKEDYDFVLNYILARVPQKAKKRL